MATQCNHTVTKGKKGEKGSWCISCSKKIFEVDHRECQHCKHSKKLITGMICRPKLMGIIPTMNVTYEISDGTCFE